jgi:hypothetical protein
MNARRLSRNEVFIAFARISGRDVRTEESFGEALDQVMRKVGSVAGHGYEIRCCAMIESGQHSRQGSREVGHPVAVHGQAHGSVHLQVSIGVDHHLADLGREPPEGVLRQRYSLEELQTLVDSAHAAAATARQNESRDVGFVDGHDGSMLSNPAGANHRIS